MQGTNGSNEEPVPRHAAAIDQSSPASVGDGSEVPRETCTTENLRNGMTFNNDNEVHQEIESTNRSNEEEPTSSNITLIDLRTSVSIEETSTAEVLRSGVNLDNEMQQETQTANRSNMEEPISSNFTLLEQRSCASNEECPEVSKETCIAEDLRSGGEVCSSHDNRELENTESTVVDSRSSARKGGKRKRELEQEAEEKHHYEGFIKSPCEGLRPRGRKEATSGSGNDINKMVDATEKARKARKPSDSLVPRKDTKEKTKGSHRCDLEGCRMSFRTKAELRLHKNNQCPHPGCGKKFSSHKYALLHQRVHDDERPLKCPWKGCTMSFKWAWARTEHIRVHTGERPYKCKVEGCGLSFRFVSDFSRHRRKTGHYVNSPT
ncbi:hypothetical protein L1049_011960 [Liquidambar formosana]|uniref:C2H2-type domain-containing protein n=1 Tax=Liquidambar formosana TaxID=63359 RepID=A0AAP0RSA9_LIQFO